MSQISSTIQPQALPRVSGPDRRSIAVAAAAIALMTIAFVAARVAAPASTSGLRSGEAVDGWQSGVTAQRAASLADSTTDGFLPGAMDTAQRFDSVDGYLPGLMSTRASSGDTVDGYLPGLIAANQIGNAADGWEAGIQFRQAPQSAVTDGWEAALH